MDESGQLTLLSGAGEGEVVSKEVRGAVGRRPQVSQLNGHYWLRCVDESGHLECSDFKGKRETVNR